MKQSTTLSRSKESSLLASSSSSYSSTEDETIIAQILLDLRNLMSLSESLKNFNWTCRRRRSCLDASPPLPPADSPSVRRTDDEIEQRKTLIKAEEVEVEEEEEKGCAARTTASPDTPLSFSPSESDEKSKHSSKKTSRKRSREEYINMIEGLAQSKEVLRGDIENVKKYYNELKAYNSQLKAMKQEVLNTCPRTEETQMEMNIGLELGQHYRIDLVHHHHQPSIADPTAANFQYAFGPIKTQLYTSSNGLGSVNHVGPFGFDLNIPAEEAFGVDQSQPSDVLADKRARCAEARRMRKGIIKIKSMRSACGIKLPSAR